MTHRAVIVGSGGQLGVELVREFAARGYEAAGYSRSELDVSDAVKVEEAVGKLEPAVVVNASAYNAVDAAEANAAEAYQVNALAVRDLAVICRKSGARLVHFSTDYVFDGTKGTSYCEDDLPCPVSAYGVSKLAGEYFAMAYGQDALVIRTSAVFGPKGRYTSRGNFVELMLRLALSGKPIKVVADSFASPTFAPALATAAVDLIERSASGLYHGGGGSAISWYDFAKKIFEAAGLSPNLSPTSEKEFPTIARRPRYSALSNGRLAKLGLDAFPPLEDAIRQYLKSREDGERANRAEAGVGA